MNEYVDIFKSLSDKTRLRILRILLEADTKELCVCEIMDSLEVEQYNVSNHLKELRVAGLVKGRKEGRFVFYRLNKEKKFLKYLFRTVLSIPEKMFKSDIERLRKRLSLRVGCKVVVTMKKGTKK